MGQKSFSEGDLEVIDWDSNPRQTFSPGAAHRFRLKEAGNFDVEVIGGGGGGSGTRTRSEGGTGGGGDCAHFTSPVGSTLLNPGIYLVVVGTGGEGGFGSLNHSAPSETANGVDGGESGLWHLPSNETIPILVSAGGSGGREQGGSTVGQSGRDFIDPFAPAGSAPIGTGGPGGSYGGIHGAGGDGGEATGIGAGGGGQGAGLLQIDDGKRRGGRGANGRVTMVRRSHH